MNVHHFAELDSTNSHLIRLAEQGADEWTVVTADIQTSGRGREGRKWWSPEGSLYMSILIKPETGLHGLMRLPLLASLALLDAIGDAGSSLKVKWPNDVVFEGRKIAGILVESRSEGGRILWAVAGFGVNMFPGIQSAPADLEGRLGYIQELDEGLTKDELSGRMIEAVQKWSGAMDGEGWNTARREWSRRAVLGIPYVYRGGGREVTGIPLRLDNSGGLVMETDDGEITVYSGELNEV